MRLRNTLAAAALLVPALFSHADTLDYTYTVTSSTECSFLPFTCPAPGQVLEFQASSQRPTVDSFTATTFNTPSVVLIRDTTSFLFGSPGDYVFSQFEVTNNVFPNTTPAYLTIVYNTPLFSGSTSSPTLSTGTFSATLRTEESSLTDVGTLTVTDISSPPPTSPVPEPSSLALLGTGLLGIVAAARRRLS